MSKRRGIVVPRQAVPAGDGHDRLLAPHGVLLGQADDQLLDIGIQLRPARCTMGKGPGPGDQPPMPAQQRRWRDEEAGPTGWGQDAADRGEQGTVGWFQLGSWGLSSEDGELVAQDEDLQVLGGIAAGEQDEQLDGAAQGQVGESRQHAGWPPQWR
jgi:hypothetical protein